jgi:hypothetical protein
LLVSGAGGHRASRSSLVDPRSPPEGFPGLVPRLRARDPDIAKQTIVELAQVLPLAPSLMHAPKRSEPLRKNCACYCRLAPKAQSLSQL